MIKLGKKTINSSSVFSFWLKNVKMGHFPVFSQAQGQTHPTKPLHPFGTYKVHGHPPPAIHKNYQSIILFLEWPGAWHNGPKKSSYLVKRVRNLISGGQNACSRVCFLWPEIKPKPSKTTWNGNLYIQILCTTQIR